jgi:ABC-type amino acid transport substrate-binding protein
LLGRLRLLLLTFVLVFALAACGGGEGEEAAGDGEGGEAAAGGETVTVASDIAYRPFEFVEGGEPVGFDIDLINEIAERAGFEADIQNVTFDGIIPGLQGGQYDLAISAMTITEERAQQVAFSDPYFNADQSLLVRADSDIQSLDDLTDATVGVQLGTTGAMLATEYQQEGRIGELTTFDTIEDAFLALENNQVDAVINDFPVSADRAETSTAELEIVETFPTGEQYGIAFPQDSELIEPVNQALQEIKDDGTYAEIYEKWFGQEPEEIP